MKAIVQHFYGTTQEWETENPLLYKGVWGFEVTREGKLNTKLGNGRDKWKTLKYFDLENIKGLEAELQILKQAIKTEEETLKTLAEDMRNQMKAIMEAEETERKTFLEILDKRLENMNRRMDENNYLCKYLMEFIEKRLGEISMVFPFVTENGEYLVTESGDFFVAA